MTAELRRQMARSMTEDELLIAITEAAQLLGWRWTHHRRSDRALVMGHKGQPDVLLAKGGRTLYLELKDATGVVTSDQWAWIEALGNPQRMGFQHLIDVYGRRDAVAAVVRPSDLDDVIRELKR